jgi:hypothetical protein
LGDFAISVLGSVNVSDGPGPVKGIERNIEMIDKHRGNKAFCSSAINKSADFGMKGSGVEFDESMN